MFAKLVSMLCYIQLVDTFIQPFVTTEASVHKKIGFMVVIYSPVIQQSDG